MASHDDLSALNCHQASDVIPGNSKTFTFHCRNVVIRLTCNVPSKEAVEHFQAALHGILHRIAEEAQTGGSQD